MSFIIKRHKVIIPPEAAGEFFHNWYIFHKDCNAQCLPTPPFKCALCKKTPPKSVLKQFDIVTQMERKFIR